MDSQELIYHVEGRTAWITINREAKRNAISLDVITSFMECLDRAEQDHNVRVVCVTGAGDKAFCAGADLSGPQTGGAKDSQQMYADLLKRISGFPKPTVARVNGHCLAGGLGFMLACDLVIARDTAEFGTPEVNVGLWPMMIGALIFRNAPRKKAMDMILLGRRMNAPEAERMGLVTRVVPTGDLDREVDRVLNILADKSPIGMKLGKEAFYTMQDMPFEEALDYLCGQLKRVVATEDAVEGITAFMEKRKPDFKGR